MSNQDYDAVLFDLDGTLVETTPEHRYIVAGTALKELGIAVPDRKKIDSFWFGKDRDLAIMSVLGIDDHMIFWHAFNSYDTVELRRQYTRPYEDVKVLPYIAERYLTGIVTAAPKVMADLEIGLVEEFLGKSESELFRKVIIARSQFGVEPKPSPDGIIKCLADVGASKERAMFVGNADEDVLAARNAGVLPVYVDRGEYEFQIREPHAKILTLYQLRSWIGL